VKPALLGRERHGQLGDGTTPIGSGAASVSLDPISSVLSISLNIDPRVTLETGCERPGDVLAACEEGQELHVDVVLTQGAVSGRGAASRRASAGSGATRS